MKTLVTRILSTWDPERVYRASRRGLTTQDREDARRAASVPRHQLRPLLDALLHECLERAGSSSRGLDDAPV